MKKDLSRGITLSEEGNNEEAYLFFSEVIKKEPNNIDAIYFRSFIDFFHLKKNILQTYRDFKLLVDKKTKYYDIILPLLVIICDDLGIVSEVLKYGSVAIEMDTPYIMDMKSIYVKALRQTNDPTKQIEALRLIESLMESDEDAQLEFHLQKIDIQIKFNDLEGADKSIEKMFTVFPPNGNMYYMKGKYLLALSTVKKEKEYVEDAKRAFEISLEFDPKLNGSRLLLAETYAIEKNIDRALEIIDGFKILLEKDASDEENKMFEADLVVEKIKICEVAGAWEKGLEICTKYLENGDSWKVYYSLGYIQNIIATSKEELLAAKNNILKAYEVQKDIFFMPDIVTLNIILKNFEENDKLLNEAIASNPENGLLYYLLADNTMRVDYNYDEIYSYYEKALKYGYLDQASFVCHTSFLVEDPKTLCKKNHKILMKSNIDTVWEKRKAGIRYLFGECGFKQNIELANKILKECNNLEPNEPCILTIYGRSEEFLGNAGLAFECYKKAYEIYQKEVHMTCNCASGYLAYAYLNGVGTEVNKELAKSLIKDAMEKEEGLSACVNIYHYAYFSLLNEDGFDKNKAIEYLSSNFPFDRYDITRALIMNKLCKSLGLEEKYNQSDIKKILKNLNKEYTDYYNMNKNKDIVYPYYKSF